jgi:hypothetical protein
MAEHNPFTAPNSNVRDIELNQGRPALVWIIFVYYMFSVVATLITYGVVLSGVLNLSDEVMQSFTKLAATDYAISIAFMLLNTVACILLFRLRKSSFYFFCISIVFSLSVFLGKGLMHGTLASGSWSSYIPIAFGHIIKLAICIYVWRLWKTGVLK